VNKDTDVSVVEKKDYQFNFEKLEVWKRARGFVVVLYKVTETFPKREWYGLVDQIRRAGVSVAANLAEGSSRSSFKDQAHFSQLAYSSLMEVASHIYIARDLNYLKESDLDKLKGDVFDISNMINSLRRYQRNNS
jgi:four helix bundle protein